MNFLDKSLLPRTMKAGRNSCWFKSKEYTRNIYGAYLDILYTLHGKLATIASVNEDKPTKTMELTPQQSSKTHVAKKSVIAQGSENNKLMEYTPQKSTFKGTPRDC